jgi:ABC-type histidine transport system ATPase subunit
MTDTAKISVAGLHKSFGAKKVLRGVDLSIGTGVNRSS